VERTLLDHVAPGPTIAFQGVSIPAGPSQGAERWSIRAKAYYYLDRTLVNYPRVEDLARDSVRFVIAHKKTVPDLVAAGYEEVLILDESYRLLQRLPAANPGAP
jgi:hypothetical protein